MEKFELFFWTLIPENRSRARTFLLCKNRLVPNHRLAKFVSIEILRLAITEKIVKLSNVVFKFFEQPSSDPSRWLVMGNFRKDIREDKREVQYLSEVIQLLVNMHGYFWRSSNVSRTSFELVPFEEGIKELELEWVKTDNYIKREKKRLAREERANLKKRLRFERYIENKLKINFKK